MPDSEQASGALSGLKIVELAEGIPAPYCAKLLGDMGARVVKIERPRVGDRTRYLPPFYHDEPSPDSGLLFNFLNTGKLGITLDIETSLGRSWFENLLADADVLVFGGERADVERLGIAPDGPAGSPIVTTCVTPFGLSGPYADRHGGELVSFQMSSLGRVTPGGQGPSPERQPLKAGGSQALFVAGLTAAVATMQAVFARELSGEGQLVDLSQVEPLISFQFTAIADWLYTQVPGERRDRPLDRLYETQDGHMTMMQIGEQEWYNLLEIMGSPAWASEIEVGERPDPWRLTPANRQRLQEWLSTQDKEYVFRQAQERRVPAYPVNTISEAVESRQIKAREFIREIPLANGASTAAPIAPYVFSGTPVQVTNAAPRLGQHNQQVLGDGLGVAKEVLVDAYAAGII